jgi:hypothetical protein
VVIYIYIYICICTHLILLDAAFLGPPILKGKTTPDSIPCPSHPSTNSQHLFLFLNFGQFFIFICYSFLTSISPNHGRLALLAGQQYVHIG